MGDSPCIRDGRHFGNCAETYPFIYPSTKVSSIQTGPLNAELFEDFVEHHVLPNTTPYLGPRSIIVLDNASIHKSGRLRELCEHSGVILEFLPPYLPDFNPIEATFKDLKVWIRLGA